MISKCTLKNNINLNSYNKKRVVDYYNRFSTYGLLNYEKYIIDKFIKNDGKILDIGCGTGRITKTLNKLGYSIIGIDYSEEMIKIAKKGKPNTEFYINNVLDLMFDNDNFKYAIFSFNGLMLIETYKKRVLAMKEIYRVLQNHGIFFFTTPFLDNKVKKEYWDNKIKKYNKKISDFTNYERMELGNEYIEDYETQFFIHIPFLSEVFNLIKDSKFELIFFKRRLDLQCIENCENELDDNYIWVVKKNVLL